MTTFELMTALPLLYMTWSTIRRMKETPVWVTVLAVVIGATFWAAMPTHSEGASPFNLMTALFACGWALADYFYQKQTEAIKELRESFATQHKVHQDERSNDAQAITCLEREIGDFAMTQDIFSTYLKETGTEEKFYEFVRAKLPEYSAQKLH